MFDINGYMLGFFGDLKGYLKFFEKSLHQEFLGFETFYIFITLMFICLFFLLYLLFAFRLRRTVRKFNSLSDKFEGFKDEINLQVASIKAKGSNSKNSAESVIDDMLGATTSKSLKVEEKGEQTDIRAINGPEEFIENAGEPTGEVGEVSIPTEGKKEIPKAPIEDSVVTDAKIEVSVAIEEESKEDLEKDKQIAQNPALEDKVEEKEKSKSVGDLFEGLDDVSNPFAVPIKASESEEIASNDIKEPEIAPQTENIEQPPEEPDHEIDIPTGVEIVEPVEELEQEKVEIQSDEKVSWDDKTAMKDDDVLDSEELIEIGEDLPEGDFQDTVAPVDEPDDSDKTSVDQIDQNTDFGSEEISIDLSDEPHKTINADGFVEERRSSERIQEEVNVELIFEGFTNFIAECSVNISETGIFIKTSDIKPVGTKIQLDVKLRDGYKLLKGIGEVVRVEASEGMGIKFLSLDTESQTLVNRILDQRKP